MDLLNQQHRKANTERIASYTVGIASDRNTGVGTGTLALLDGEKFILTAKHVLGNSKPDELHFWLRPPTAMRDKAAKDTTNEEVGSFTAGEKLPIVDAQLDDVRDVAALRLDPSYALPDGPEFYDMRRSVPLMKWNEKELDELTLLMVGFPIDNSREVTTEGNRKFMFMGVAEHLSNYSAELNTKIWSGLNPSFHGTRTSRLHTTATQRNTGQTDLVAVVYGCLEKLQRKGLDSRPNHDRHRTQLVLKIGKSSRLETACVH